MQLKILYEDENLVAIDKPEGIASITENKPEIITVHSWLQKKYSHKIFIVHRLDKDVSGVIIFAKNSTSHKFLYEQFFNYKVEKKYIALVYGLMKEDIGRIEKPIRQFGSGRMGVDVLIGKKSITDYQVLKRFDSYTLVELKPKTGRRHQLRVHLYSIGHPIVGDKKYGNKLLQEKRLMLHAKEIELFIDNKNKIKITSEIPDSFNEVVQKLCYINLNNRELT